MKTIEDAKGKTYSEHRVRKCSIALKLAKDQNRSGACLDGPVTGRTTDIGLRWYVQI